jgi:holliday junction DNA helicase RuvA
MIASLNGEVTEIANDSLVLKLGGLGIKVYVPTPLSSHLHLGEWIELKTYLVVRQELLSLYGFETSEERDYFVLLLGVDGIGPRSALAVLSKLNPENIRRAVATEQVDMFSRAPGIGKKTAQKIILHLQGRLHIEAPLSQVSSPREVDADVLAALTSLGYNVVEAQTAIQSLPRDTPQDVEIRLRLALQYFSA